MKGCSTHTDKCLNIDNYAIWWDRSQIGKHVLDVVFLFGDVLLVGDLDGGTDIDVFACDVFLLVGVDLVHEVCEHFLGGGMGTSTSSSSESSSSISFILSSIYFWRILASLVSRMMSCILSAYFSCSFMCSPTLSRALTVSMSMMACSSWNFLSTSTFFLSP